MSDIPSRQTGGLHDRFLTAVPPLIWGSTYLVTTSFLPADRPFTIAFLRAMPAGLLLLAFARQLPKGDWWWRTAVLGGLNIGLFLAMLFVAAYRLPGGVAATVLSSQPLIVVLLLRYGFGEHRRLTALVGAVIGLVGVALLVLTPKAALDGIGLAAGLVGALAMATGLVLTQRWSPPVPPLTLTAWQLCAGGLWLAAPAFLLESGPFPVTFTSLGALAYLGLIGAAATYVLWFRGLARLDARVVSALSLLSPVCATLLGWVVLGQRLGATQLLGLGLTLFGMWLSQRRPAKETLS